MKILLIDRNIQDMIGLRWYIQTYLAGNHQIEYTTNMTDAITKLHMFQPDILFINLDLLPDSFISSIYIPLQQAECHIFAQANDTLYKTAQKAIAIHAKALWAKPFDLEQFLKKITSLPPINKTHQDNESFYNKLFQQDDMLSKRFTLIEPEEKKYLPSIYKWLHTSISFQHAEIYPLSSTIILLIPEETVEKDIRMLINQCPFTINICIVDELLSIQQSYNKAKNRLQQRFYEGYGHVLHSSKQIQYIPFDPLLNPSLQSKLMASLEQLSIEEFQQILQPLRTHSFEPEDVRVHLTSMLAQIRRFMLSQSFVDSSQLETRYFHVYRMIIEHPILFNILEELTEFTAQLMQFVNEKRKNETKGYVDRAKEYIEVHYSNKELSLQLVAKHLGLNANYLSTLFTKETKLSFSKTVLQIRINKSIELLRTSSKSIAQIAIACGFEDANYFSKCFKKFYGVSPTLYREQLLNKQ